MEDLLVDIYMKKHIKYCSGCLNTEYGTKLSSMETYSWVFTDLFTKLYLKEEIKSSFICSWCVKRLINAQKLFQHFQRAQYILTKIADNLCNETLEFKRDLSLQINDLIIASRLHYNASSYNIKSNIHPEPYESEIKIENDIEHNYDDDFRDEMNVDCENKNSSNYRLLQSEIIEKDNYKIEEQMNIPVPKERSCRDSKSQILNKIPLSKKHKRYWKRKKRESTEKTDVKNNPDCSKCVSFVSMQESCEKIMTVHSKKATKNIQTRLHGDADVSDIDDVPLSNIKSQIKAEKTDQNLDVAAIPKSKSVNKKMEKNHRYLPHLPRIPCSECDRLFIKRIALENHMIHNHKKKFPCDKCNRIFTKQECLKIHIAKVHEPKSGTFECAICATVYKHRVKMVEHMIRHDKYGPSLKDLHSIVCHHCGKVCSRKSIKTHLTTHSDEKPYHCIVCNRHFKGALALENHIKRNHNPDIGKHFECPHCPKKFYLSSDVRCHVHAVHFCKNQKCLICSKSFRTISKLREHVLRVHEKVPAVRNKQCEYCDKAFSTNRQLTHHRYIHTGEKPYKCDLCNSAYNQKHCLVMHKLRAHNIEKPTKSIAGNISTETVTENHKTQEYSDTGATWYTVANG